MKSLGRSLRDKQRKLQFGGGDLVDYARFRTTEWLQDRLKDYTITDYDYRFSGNNHVQVVRTSRQGTYSVYCVDRIIDLKMPKELTRLWEDA